MSDERRILLRKDLFPRTKRHSVRSPFPLMGDGIQGDDICYANYIGHSPNDIVTASQRYYIRSPNSCVV